MRRRDEKIWARAKKKTRKSKTRKLRFKEQEIKDKKADVQKCKK